MSIADIWNWIMGKGKVIEEVKPLIVDGEAVVADLERIIKDIKSGNYIQSVSDAKQIVADVTVFATEVEKVITALQTVQAMSGPVDHKAKVHGQHNNRMKGHGQNDKAR